MKQKIADYLISRKHYLKAFAVYLLISLVMFWQVTINLFSYVVNGYGDVYQSLFNLWWVPHAVFSLHQSPYFTGLLFYPIGANLVTQTLTPLAGLLTLPLQLISGAFAYNALFFSSFALSGVFMFALSNYFVKNKYASFLAGLVFAFAPMHIAQAYGHLDWTIIEWVPLFLLLYIKTIDEKKLKYAAFASISFVLLTFMGDIEQGIMVFFATIVFTLLYLLLDRRKLLNRGTIMNLGAFAVLTLIFSSPFIIAMLPYLGSGAFSAAQQNSGVTSSMMWSNNLLSFLLPSYYNGIFNSAAQSYTAQLYGLTYKGITYQIDIGDRVSFIGYTVLALVLIALYFDLKRNSLRHLSIWLILGIVFAWLSLGPYLQVGSVVTGVPTIYMLYRAVPILNIIREPGRFDLIVTICLAMTAAFGFDQLVRDRGRKYAFNMLLVLSVLILIEYNGMPLSQAFASQLITSTHIPRAYTEIGKIPGNFSVLILPALLNSSNAPARFPGLSTYYVSALQKPIIGGYTSRETYNQSVSVSAVPLIQSASYLEQGFGLIYPSPINENFSNVTLLWLANYNTEFVSVTRSAYDASGQAALYAYLTGLFGQAVYQSNSTFVFSTANAIRAKAAKSLVAYTMGNWTPGYSFCSSYQCNRTLASEWWGPNPRLLIIFSPKVDNVRMSFTSLALAPNTTLGLYLNNNPVQNLMLHQSPTGYSVNMTLPQGFSQLVFYSKSAPVQPYLTFGVENITFSR